MYDVPSDEITDGASHQRVGSEVILAGESCGANCARGAEGGSLDPAAAVFVRDDGGHRPRHDGVTGRKRFAALPEGAVMIAASRTLAVRRCFEREHYDGRIR